MSGKTPSFDGLEPASEISSRSKRANKRTDTLHEVQLRRELWRLGLRYRKNVKDLPGKPDIVFIKAKVVVFCDGDFWHGRDWDNLSLKLKDGTNSSYWLAKIKCNIERDIKNNRNLEEAGWYVIRLWETNINKDPVGNANQIKVIISNRIESLKRGH